MTDALMITGAVIACIYGAVVGSFLNVCIYRLPRGESIVAPPSHCPKCAARLRAPDLIPILSFLLLKRKCRYCGAPISWRYAIIEGITALLFLATWLSLVLRFQPETMTDTLHPMLTSEGLLIALAVSVFVATMLVTFVIDLETTYVIEPVTWIAMVAGVVTEVVTKHLTVTPIAFTLGSTVFPALPAAVPGMALGFFTFVAMDLFGRLIFRKPGMGLGDAFIGAAIGAMLGPVLALLAFGLAVFGGALVGVVMLTAAAISERRTRKAGKAPAEIEEAPAPALSIVPSLVSSGALVLVVLVEGVISAVFGRSLENPGAGATVVALLFGVTLVAVLVITSRLIPEEAPVAEDEPILPEGGFYMPFGPFLTAAAVLIVLAPTWVQARAHDLWAWYLMIISSGQA
jgi:leader peptidase (prepilin peptidase) / N-methyltransferase